MQPHIMVPLHLISKVHIPWLYFFSSFKNELIASISGNQWPMLGKYK